MQSVNSDVQRVAQRLTGLALKRFGFALGVYGPPGIGKTYTVLALLRGAHCRSLTVHATQPLEGTLLQLPRPKKLSAWLERSLERLRSGEALTVEALLQTLAGVLSGNAPFILHVEDLHESNPERLEFWTQLALTATRLRGVALIVTSRTQPPAPLEAIGLLPLTREASDALLGVEAGAALPTETLEWMYGSALGNPLFSLEFFRFLARQGTLWNDGHRWRWRTPQRGVMPVTIEALIEQILGKVSSTPVLEAAIRARAVLGIGASQELWALVAELTPEKLELASEELERLGVFSNRDFAHPLYREVALSNVTLEQRRLLARRAIDALQADPESAAQFLDDAELEPSIALELLERAARITRAAGNELRAARLQAKAVAYAIGERRATLAFEAARVLDKADRPEAMRLLRISLEEQPKHTETIFWLAGYYADLGQSGEVERLLSRISDDEKALLGWIKRQISLRFALGDYAGVLQRWEAESRLHSDPDPILAYNVGFARSLQDDQVGAETIALVALEQHQLSALIRARLWTVCGLSWHYRHDQNAALIRFDKALAAAIEAENPAFTAASLHNRAMVWEHTNQVPQMLVDTEEALRLYAEVGIVRYYASTLTKKARILHELGQYERAEECFYESRKLLLQSDASSFLVTCEAHLSDLYLDWQPSNGSILALKHAELALRAARPIGGSKLFMSLNQYSRAETFKGNARRGLELADECVRLMQASENNEYQPLTARGLAFAQLGDIENAQKMFQDAYQIALTSDWRVYAEKIGLEIARITHDIGRAREHLAWFEENGLMNGANIARRYFPELVTDTVPQSSTHLEPQALTRLEVLGTMQLRREASTTPLRGAKRKELLAMLLEARICGRVEVSSTDLCDALYEADELGLGALKATVFKIRHSLGAELIVTTASGYALGAVTSDAEEFLKRSDTLLWRGPYLEDAGLAGRDEQVREALNAALEGCVKNMLKTDPPEAERLARLLVQGEPYDLNALELACHALHGKSLARLYADARTRFHEVGEVLPEYSADFLMRGEAADAKSAQKLTAG